MFHFMVPTVITNNNDTRIIDKFVNDVFLVHNTTGILLYNNRKTVSELLSIIRADGYYDNNNRGCQLLSNERGLHSYIIISPERCYIIGAYLHLCVFHGGAVFSCGCANAAILNANSWVVHAEAFLLHYPVGRHLIQVSLHRRKPQNTSQSRRTRTYK